MAGSFDLTGTDLSTLFDRYPDIKFDLAEDLAEASSISEHFSTPSSDVTDHDTTTASKDSISTAHTSPLRPSSECTETHDFPTLDRFLKEVDSADLPLECKAGFEGLGREMVTLGSLLVPDNEDHWEGHLISNTKRISIRAHSLLGQLKEVNRKVAEEVENTDFVRTRAPFTVEPKMQDLWCNYRQRAQLITQ